MSTSPDTSAFSSHIEHGYTFKGDSIILGTAMLDGQALPGQLVRAPLKMFNRHGLISGATGTGKTKTLQLIAERLSEKGVPVLLMDIKGDLSGLSQASAGHPKIDERHTLIGLPWQAQAYPCEFLSISDQSGVRMRATVSEFGPVLLSKILDLNTTQSGILSIVFRYCDEHSLPLLDLKDLRAVLQYLSGDGKADIEQEYGRVSAASVGAIMRSIVTLEEQGAERFFGERSFEVKDLLRRDRNGMGYLSILRLDDIQSRPRLFSTFMLSLLAEIYEQFPERGDQEKPELVLFIDEAHLVFDQASKVLMEQLETIIKLIRSKGVGIFFVTQDPSDIPDAVLGQLGMKVQHALRAFTAKDRKAIRMAAENYPLSPFYKTDQLLTTLGVGEALVTVLNEKGIPTPLVHTLLRAPASRMDVIDPAEKQRILEASALYAKYAEEIDRKSAFELLQQKMEAAGTSGKGAVKEPHQSRRKQKSLYDQIGGRSLTRMIVREVARGLLGVLKRKR